MQRELKPDANVEPPRWVAGELGLLPIFFTLSFSTPPKVESISLLSIIPHSRQVLGRRPRYFFGSHSMPAISYAKCACGPLAGIAMPAQGVPQAMKALDQVFGEIHAGLPD
jgi:hypothetical protein